MYYSLWKGKAYKTLAWIGRIV